MNNRLFFPKGMSLITWYVSVRPCSRPGIFLLLLLAAFYSLLSDDPLRFPCPGWNTWFYDCISNMLLLRAEFDTDPSPTLSHFSCTILRNLVTSEKSRVHAAIKMWQKSASELTYHKRIFTLKMLLKNFSLIKKWAFKN